tara:strand:+ start:66 stop:695 length:630 start_codon:yes stop_codon:yes gene_type:complete
MSSELKPTAYELFPSLVYHSPFLNKEECEMYVKCLDNVEKESLPFAQRPLYQTTDKLHLLNDTWKKLSDRIIDVVNSIADHQHIIRDSLYNTNMWANISAGPGYFHAKHSHPNCFFSSIIYLRGNESSETIFHDPRPQTNMLMPDYSQSNRYNTTAFRLPFEEGFIAIFPAWLPHDVLSEGNDNSNRITLTCNTMMHFECTTRTTYLKI